MTTGTDVTKILLDLQYLMKLEKRLHKGSKFMEIPCHSNLASKMRNAMVEVVRNEVLRMTNNSEVARLKLEEMVKPTTLHSKARSSASKFTGSPNRAVNRNASKGMTY